MAFRNFPWNRFTKRIRIKPIPMSPHNTIRRWLKEKKKTVTIDPIRRKKKTTTEKKIKVNNLRTVVSQLFNKVNEIVDYIRNFNSTVVEMIRTEVRIREEEDERLERLIRRQIYEELDRKIENNYRRIRDNFVNDSRYRRRDTAAMAANVAGDLELRSRFETHRNTPPVTPFPPFFPLTHAPGVQFEEGGTLDTPIEGRRYEVDSNKPKPKPLTKTQRKILIDDILENR